MKKYIIVILASLISGATLFADNAAPDKMNKPPHRKVRGKFKPAPWFWMAFSNLTPKERQEMLKLQREDPEKFRSEMARRADATMKAEMERRKKLSGLVEAYKKADGSKKAEIKAQIQNMIRENFKKRLTRSQMQLEELKERAEKLEKELALRAKAEDKIVDAVVNNILTGKFPHADFKGRKGKFPPNGGGRRGAFPHPPPPMPVPPAPLQAE